MKIFGAVVLVLTILFFMLLVGIAIAGHEVPPGTHVLVVIVLALGLAVGSAFLGGAAAVEGNVPIPGVTSHPLAFSVTGGVAVFVIVMLIGYFVYPEGGDQPYKPVEEVSSQTTTGWEQMKIDLIAELEAHKNRENEIETVLKVLKAMSTDAERETQGEKESRVYAYSSKAFLKDAVQFSARAGLGVGKYECTQANTYIRRAGISKRFIGTYPRITRWSSRCRPLGPAAAWWY